MVSVFVVLFHAISPLAAVFHSKVCPLACVVAALLLLPRVTVHVVVPNPAVTVMYSSSTRITKAVVGKPVADATVTVVADAVRAPVSVVLAPWPTRQKYELEGVRSATDETLLSRLG